ncbi:zinc finger and BTB domain-containing protein 17 [Exaiptasia diaphana]|uniref:C2H2-type domain-containing protein n=1 Tax=Exaiptasia diaphana TaxID=2652724 RepID=A0A913XQH9_EXADI|nr:zinc finger and BTB domain-containing protein 17 [Exaiptasia diaphana]KXJ09713.1 putative zinc finger protein 727 [Exaiptasia diaphana]
MSFEQVESGELSQYEGMSGSNQPNTEDSSVEQNQEKSDEIQNKDTTVHELQEHVSSDTTSQDNPTPEVTHPEVTQPEVTQPEVTQPDPEVQATTEDTSAPATQLQSGEQESTYANLQPIFLAMEMGQEAIQTSQHGEQPATTTAELSQSSQTVQVSQAISEQANQMVFSQQVLSNLATSVGEGTTSVSLQSILQDVVSGIPTTSGTVPAAIITDPSSSTGSYLIVNQNGVPIVRPVLVSNMPESGMNGSETLQVLATGVHGMEGGDGQETVTVEVSAHNEPSSTGASGVSGMAEEPNLEMSTDSMAMRMHTEGSGDEDSTPSRLSSAKRKLSDGPRICEQCNKAFKYPSDLKKHLQIHTNIKKFKCEDCGRFFRRLHQLNVHMRIHTGEKPYVCNRCGVSFRHDSTLTMHIRTRHDHLRPFKCDECGNTFGRLSHLRKHVRKVCGNRLNKDRSIAQCRFCEENFPTKSDLRKHVLICEKKEAKVKAKEVTLHVCDQCSKDFASPYNLKRHLLTHTDEKPFQCEVCARQFKEKSSLSKHMKRKHTGVDQGSQTEETGETEFNSVDVIAESAAASGVAMETEEVETGIVGTADGSSTVDASSLMADRVQGDVEMTTIELSLPPGAESHEATALQAAVEALVSASQQQMAVDHSIEVPTEDATAGKVMYAGGVPEETVAHQVGLVDASAALVATEVKDVTAEGQVEEFVGTTGQEEGVASH